MNEGRNKGRDVKIHIGLENAKPLFNVAFNAGSYEEVKHLMEKFDYDFLIQNSEFREGIWNGINKLIVKSKDKRLEPDEVQKINEVIKSLRESLTADDPLN